MYYCQSPLSIVVARTIMRINSSMKIEREITTIRKSQLVVWLTVFKLDIYYFVKHNIMKNRLALKYLEACENTRRIHTFAPLVS